jgi:hypothetical protein
MVFRFLGPRFGQPSSAGVPPTRSILRGSSSVREAALERELAALRAQQAALARQERVAAQNLDALRDSLDVLAGEIDKRAKASRDPDLQKRGERMITDVKAFLAKQGDCDIKPSTVTAAIKIGLGLEPLPHRFAAPRAPPAAVVPIDPARRAAEIVAAGRKARAETPPEKPSDPTAAGIVAAGRRARNEPTDE